MNTITPSLTETLQSSLAALPADLQTQLATEFAKFTAESDEWMAKSKAIVVTDASHTQGMLLARETRLELKCRRVAVEKARVRLKAFYLAGGRAIDGIANPIMERMKEIEAECEAKEEFVERKAAAEKAARTKNRAQELLAISIDPGLYETPMDCFDDAQWSAFVQGQKDAQEAARKRAEAEAEAASKERARVAALEAENRRLAAEKDAAERKVRLEKFRAQQAAEAEAKRVKDEADKVAAEHRRIRDEAAGAARRIEREADAWRVEQEHKVAKLKADHEAAIAAERAEAKRILDARDRVEREEREARALESGRVPFYALQMTKTASQAQAIANELAAMAPLHPVPIHPIPIAPRSLPADAPDKEKLVALVETLNKIALPEMSTENGTSILKLIVERLADLEDDVKRLVNPPQ
jgi:hypothetical protein